MFNLISASARKKKSRSICGMFPNPEQSADGSTLLTAYLFYVAKP